MNTPQFPAGFPGGAGPMPLVKPRFGGLAVASLVLGIIAMVFSIIPVVNVVGMLVGIVGLALGLVGLFGGRKVMSAFGVTLSVLAIVLAFVVNKAFVDEVDRQVGNQGLGAISTGGAVVTTVAAPAAPATPTFGQTYTWPGGLAIEVTKPSGCTPSRSSHPQTVQRGVKFGIVITNNTSAPFDSALLSMGMQAQYSGRAAERIIDLTGDCKVNNFDSATVLPGKHYAWTVALAVGAEPGEMQLTFQPGLLADKIAFVGTA